MKTNASAAALLSLLLTLGYGNDLSAQEPASKPKQIAVNLFGEVIKPGRYLLPEGATALDALAAAGGEKPEARLAKVKLIHATTGDRPLADTVDMKAVLAGTSVAPVLHDGDSLSFPRSYINIAY